MADMTSIINEIKGLEQYTKTMRTVYEQKGLREDLDNLLMHINNLKAWAGIDVEAGENTLPIQRVSNSVCKTCRDGFWLRKNTKCLDCGKVCLG